MVILVRRPLWERVVLLLSIDPDRAGEQHPPDRGDGRVLPPVRPGDRREDRARLRRLAMMPLALVLVWLELKVMSWLVVEVEEVDAAGAAPDELRRRPGAPVMRAAAATAPRAASAVKIVYLNPGGAIGGAEMCLLDVLASLRADRPDWPLVRAPGRRRPAPRRRSRPWASPATSCRCPPGVAAARGRRARPARGGGWLALAARGPRPRRRRRSAYLRAARGPAPRRAARPGPDQRHEGAPARRLGRPAGVPVVWHLHDYLGSRPVMARLLAVVGPAGRRRGGRLATRWPTTPRATLRAPRPGPTRSTTPSTSTGSARPRRRRLARRAPPGLPDAAGGDGPRRPGRHVRPLEGARRLPRRRRAGRRRPARAVLRRRRPDLPLGRLAGLGRGAARRRPRRSGWAGGVGFAGHQADPAAVVPGARRGRPREHPARAVRPGDRRGDGLRPGRGRDRRTGARPSCSTTASPALGCPPGDPDALAAAIARLIADAGLRERLGRGRAAGRGRPVRPRATRRRVGVRVRSAPVRGDVPAAAALDDPTSDRAESP